MITYTIDGPDTSVLHNWETLRLQHRETDDDNACA